ncbi:signal peptidase I [Denitrificimonas caeni]|uniref:signal peptidase I n=1 Tax=Denitrificimonas caeni TaxID=521720 RepID=UPI00196626B5|nr:signal peptidase I [Denitrificimonas caeni]
MTFNFPLILAVAVAVSGLLALLDVVYFAPRRRAAIAQYEKEAVAYNSEVRERLEKEPVLIEYGKSFFPVLAVVFVLRSFIVEPFQIPSGSMIPTLEVGDFILVNKFAYGIRLPVIDEKIIEISDPKRGDVMVFKYPEDTRINYIKRVVGLPGDIITYTNEKRILINGKPVAETFLGEEPGSLGSARLYTEQLGEQEHYIRKEMRRRTEPTREWRVPAGHYFMMGDNRDNSKDSRYWDDPSIPFELQGMVPDEYIVGKAFAIWLTWADPKFSALPSLSRAGLIH